MTGNSTTRDLRFWMHQLYLLASLLASYAAGFVRPIASRKKVLEMRFVASNKKVLEMVCEMGGLRAVWVE